jgi:ankyrin repeat protein
MKPTIFLFVFSLAILAVVGHQSNAALPPPQQAKANAALLGLWGQPGAAYDAHRGQKVTVAQVRSALNEGADVDATAGDESGNTSLMLAAGFGNVDCVKLLVSKGANVNSKDKGGWTPLILAVTSRNPACVEFLASHGADVNAVAPSADMSVLKEAIMCGNIDIVKYLLSMGASLEARDRYGWTPLMTAAFLNKPDCVRLFLSKRAILEAKNLKGETALTLAQDHPGIIAILKAAGAK